MNCELAHERIVTSAYGELADDKVHELQRHLGECAECRKEQEQLQAMKVLADVLPVLEPGPNLVARSRLRLDEALDALPPLRWYERLMQRFLNSMASLQAAPIAAGLLLVAGIGAGSLGGYEFAQNRAARAAANAPVVAADQTQSAVPMAVSMNVADVASVSSIIRKPGSDIVEVHYNQLVPQHIEGSLDSATIRQLLMLAAENSSSAGVHDDSVGLLAAECRAGHSCQAAGIRDALMVALRYDKNARVREKALEGLQPYVAEDVRVRNAVLEALLNDSDPRIRTESINLLEPVEADTSVRQVLYSVSTSDAQSSDPERVPAGIEPGSGDSVAVTYLSAIASFNHENATLGTKKPLAEKKAMKYILRPYKSLGLAIALGAGLVIAPCFARAQGNDLRQLVQGSDAPFIGSSQGYLGVELADIDNEKAQSLKLKDIRGALITLIDHDAPAGQIGLKVNDVVIQLNGQNVESAEQLRRMLKEIPSGRKVSIEISRDGNIQTLAVELADRQVLGHDVWNKIGSGGDVFAPPPSMGMLSGGGDTPPASSGFHLPFFGSSLNVGAMVEPLTSQMAEYLGVQSGLMVKQVARKSDAAAAGLKAFDVILKVGSEQVTNLAGWDRALRANQGKPVQVTILRDKKQQTLTLQVDSKHHQGSLGTPVGLTADDCPLIADMNQEFAQNFETEADEWRKQAQAFRDSVKDFKIDPRQVEQFQRQMDKLRNELNSGDLKIDQKQMDELRRQLNKFGKQMDRQLRSLRRDDYV